MNRILKRIILSFYMKQAIYRDNKGYINQAINSNIYNSNFNHINNSINTMYELKNNIYSYLHYNNIQGDCVIYGITIETKKHEFVFEFHIQKINESSIIEAYKYLDNIARL